MDRAQPLSYVLEVLTSNQGVLNVRWPDWEIVRSFELRGSRTMSYGIAAQSPIGDGCVVRFDALTLVERPLTGPA
jgi:hypothetical protein